MTAIFDALVEEYPAWWTDFLGEHSHVGGEEATRWLLERAALTPGARMLDAGAFVGAAARLAMAAGSLAFATDVNSDFLRAGRAMPGGASVTWLAASNHKLPFRDGAFGSVWCLDSYLAPREFSRVAAARATLCLSSEVPTDGRGGMEAFIEEWAQYGWELRAHRALSNEATQTWRRAEAELVRKRPRYESRYGTRPYLAQLDLVAGLVRSYERNEQGHGLFVFGRG
ncbi:MAG: class I SAM-dependent methyltransferase [Tepidiformaceae bacterium]